MRFPLDKPLKGCHAEVQDDYLVSDEATFARVRCKLTRVSWIDAGARLRRVEVHTGFANAFTQMSG